MTDIWLLIFEWAVLDTLVLEKIFDKAFSVTMNLYSWQKVDACPLTQACLMDEKVHHEVVMDEFGAIDVNVDPVTSVLIDLETKNEMCCDLLQSIGL